MGSSASSLRALVLLLGLVFSHVTCQGFLPEIKPFNPQPPSLNRRGLICRVPTGTGTLVDVMNTVFYLNGSDIRDSLTGSNFESSTGQIIFNITPDLEGCYTCGNDTYISPEEDALKLVCKAMLCSFAKSPYTETSIHSSMLLWFTTEKPHSIRSSYHITQPPTTHHCSHAATSQFYHIMSLSQSL